ncbi:MAG: L,D-transpeptidase, partial [Atopobiaceae bacterium]|nr:L,D-transpeptidase [Atopobiaceae bacterium]
DWWMPFVNNMVAFHDAPWRSQFGGQIYYDNGSHGCVNLPPEVAKKLYELAPEGTVVVVHD